MNNNNTIVPTVTDTDFDDSQKKCYDDTNVIIPDVPVNNIIDKGDDRSIMDEEYNYDNDNFNNFQDSDDDDDGCPFPELDEEDILDDEEDVVENDLDVDFIESETEDNINTKKVSTVDDVQDDKEIKKNNETKKDNEVKVVEENTEFSNDIETQENNNNEEQPAETQELNTDTETESLDFFSEDNPGIDKVIVINIVKKIFALLALAFFVIGIPILLTLLSKPGSDENSTLDSNIITGNNELSAQETTKSVEIETSSLISKEVTSESINQNESTTYYFAGGIKDSRFQTVDDLDSYIQSTTSSLFSKEKLYFNEYANGVHTKDAYKDTINAYNDAYNELLHLLVCNKSAYMNNGYQEKYLETENLLIKAITYNDVSLYCIDNMQLLEMIETLNTYK